MGQRAPSFVKCWSKFSRQKNDGKTDLPLEGQTDYFKIEKGIFTGFFFLLKESKKVISLGLGKREGHPELLFHSFPGTEHYPGMAHQSQVGTWWLFHSSQVFYLKK